MRPLPYSVPGPDNDLNEKFDAYVQRAIDLKDWSITDKNKRKTMLAAQELNPGATTIVMLSGEGAQLSNDGGIITLLDKQGLKIDGVSYTREQVVRQGWTIVF